MEHTCLLPCRLGEVARRFYGVMEQASGGKPRSLVPAMRKTGVMFYDDCDLQYFQERPDWDKPECFYLILKADRESSTAYRSSLPSPPHLPTLILLPHPESTPPPLQSPHSSTSSYHFTSSSLQTEVFHSFNVPPHPSPALLPQCVCCNCPDVCQWKLGRAVLPFIQAEVHLGCYCMAPEVA
jgi:hypothetical protein